MAAFGKFDRSRSCAMASTDDWLKLAPEAPPLAPGKTWHVFLSYRSIHRAWVIQLHDVLRQLGYKVFLDQFVLRANDELGLALGAALDESAAGVLVWSSKTEDSTWCKSEYAKMDTMSKDGSFHYAVVKLDDGKLPGFAGNKLFVDFSAYKDAPLGMGLLTVLHEVAGKSLSDEAVRFGLSVDEEARAASHKIAGARQIGDVAHLLELAATDSVAWRTTAALGCQVAESLIKLGRNDEALTVIQRLEARFTLAVRPRQLRGLALARKGDLPGAQRVFSELEAEGNRDPETLGMYARTWMDRYKAEKNPLFLRKSRNLYQLAFEHTPSDSYVGINAAAKSVMLGDLESAEKLAKRVEALVGTVASADYWATATVAEVQLIQRKWGEAVALYQAAVENHPTEVGSHQSTWTQADLLMKHLDCPIEIRKQLEGAFPTVVGV
jgi:hypothetical protein